MIGRLGERVNADACPRRRGVPPACHRHQVAVPPDVVISGRDGWKLLPEPKQRPATREIPAIVCSVLDEPAVAIALGAAYLQKPIDQARLLAALTPLVASTAAGPLAIA